MSPSRLRGDEMKTWISLLLILALSPWAAYADFDVNAVEGIMLIDGDPAPSGTTILIVNKRTAEVFQTHVDGVNIPPFLFGQGRYDTGDVPSLNTGDAVLIYPKNPNLVGSAETVLRAGTSRVNLSVHNASRTLPAQEPEKVEASPSSSKDATARQGGTGSAAEESLEGGLTNPMVILSLARASIDRLADGLSSLRDLLTSTLDTGMRDVSNTTQSIVASTSKGAAQAAGQLPRIGLGELLLFVVAVGGVGLAVSHVANRKIRSLALERQAGEGEKQDEPPFWDRTSEMI